MPLCRLAWGTGAPRSVTWRDAGLTRTHSTPIMLRRYGDFALLWSGERQGAPCQAVAVNRGGSRRARDVCGYASRMYCSFRDLEWPQHTGGRMYKKLSWFFALALLAISCGCASIPDLSDKDGDCVHQCSASYSQCLSGPSFFPIQRQHECTSALKLCGSSCPAKK